jgi:hypothetical protein
VRRVEGEQAQPRGPVVEAAEDRPSVHIAAGT